MSISFSSCYKKNLLSKAGGSEKQLLYPLYSGAAHKSSHVRCLLLKHKMLSHTLNYSAYAQHFSSLTSYTYVQYILCRSHVRSPRQELPCLGLSKPSKSAIAGRSTP